MQSGGPGVVVDRHPAQARLAGGVHGGAPSDHPLERSETGPVAYTATPTARVRAPYWPTASTNGGYHEPRHRGVTALGPSLQRRIESGERRDDDEPGAVHKQEPSWEPPGDPQTGVYGPLVRACVRSTHSDNDYYHGEHGDACSERAACCRRASPVGSHHRKL